MSYKARSHLLKACRQLSPFIEKLPVIKLQKKKSIHPVNAISEVVIGQMLSRDAARSIRNRAYNLSESKGYDYIANLSIEDLRAAGLSGGKIKTIKLVLDAFKKDPQRINQWPILTYEELRTDVSSFWGISDWTASILSLFYFGNPDVFPSKDGSIIRVTKKLEEIGAFFNADEARPYRSYLALYLWSILDNEII